MDVQRYLADEPVLARPPSKAYRFQKLVRRNKLVFGASVTVLASLVIGLGIAGWFIIKENKQRTIAEGERNRASAAQKKAQAAELVAQTRADQLREALRLWHSGITNLSQAETFFHQTLKTQRKSSGPDGLDLVPTLQDLASVQDMEGKLPEAIATWREALELQRKSLSEEHPAVAAALGELAAMLKRQGKLQDAETAYRQALTQLRRRSAAKPSESDHNLGIVLHHLADVLREEKSLTEARSLAQESITLYERHSEWPAGERDHARKVLVDVLKDAGDASEAQQLESRLRQTRKLAMEGISHARHGEWKAAADQLSQVAELDPSEHWAFFLLAPLLIQNGDVCGYRKDCRAMLARFGHSDAPTIAERVSKTCLLLPSAVGEDDLAKIGKLAEHAVDSGQSSQWLHWFQMTRGLAEYRQGRFTNAVEWTQLVLGRIAQAQDGAREMCEADSHFVQAMAQYQMNETEAARSALARGVDLVRTRLPKLDAMDVGPCWHDVLTAHILMHEAQALIQGHVD
jgi:tetratricopeptide (TPR) repeat protein